MCCPFLPHSPRWLLLKGRLDFGRKTLQKLRRSEDVEEELNEIKEGLEGKQGDFADTFRPNMIRPLLISFLVCIGQQVSGPNIINFYSTEIFIKSGVSNPQLATTFVGAVKVLLTIPCIFLVDKFGRRILLISGTFIELIAFVFLAISYMIHDLSPVFPVISVISVICHTIGYSYSIGPLTWILPSEMFPNDVRNFGLMMCICLNWFTSFIISVSFPLVTSLIGKYAFFPFIGGFVVVFILIIIFVPETKGKSMEELTNKI
jgi:sugar porter (SP) family MFS transporter